MDKRLRLMFEQGRINHSASNALDPRKNSALKSAKVTFLIGIAVQLGSIFV